MRQKSIIKDWVQRLSILIVLCTSAQQAEAQAKYLSFFPFSYATCQNIFTMDASVSSFPTSFPVLNDLVDGVSNGNGGANMKNYYKNSSYKNLFYAKRTIKLKKFKLTTGLKGLC